MKKILHTYIKSFGMIVFCLLAAVTVWATPAAALAECTGNDSFICTTSKENLTGGILATVITILLYIAGTIAVIMIVIGGIRYMTSNGDSTKAAQARNTIIYSVIGLVVAVMSFGIVNFVIGRL